MRRKLPEYFHLQPIGQRIIKTAVAVTICLLFYMLRGYEGSTMPAEAAITAIICMNTNVRGTRANALSRFFGTLIGAFWGFLFLVIVPQFPAITEKRWALYLLMGLGTLLALYSAVIIKKPEIAGLAAIVFVCVVVIYPDIESPLKQAFHRILDVLVGTATAIIINAVRLPRFKRRDRIFFLRMKDLAVDQFAQVPTTVLYRLQFLLQEGARVCLISEHAPAFQTTQLEGLRFTAPTIVMDGAAIYDANENTYLSLNAMEPAASRWLMKRLTDMNRSFFIYTVHRDRNCIFHHGEMTEMENAVYQLVKRSPYRYYLDDDHFSMADVVYIKIVGEQKDLEQISSQLSAAFEKEKIRAVIRPQAGLSEGCSLYFYSAHATIENAQSQLMHLLQQKEPELESVELRSSKGFRTEYDAIRLMRRLTREYAPFLLTAWIANRKAKRKN